MTDVCPTGYNCNLQITQNIPQALWIWVAIFLIIGLTIVVSVWLSNRK